MLVHRTHPFSNKKSTLDQLSSCFLFGVSYCTVNILYEYNTGILHLVQIIVRKPTILWPMLTYVPARSSVFYHTEYVYCEIVCTTGGTKYSMSQWCVVCSVVVFCASIGCGGVGMWADGSPRFPKKKKNASSKIHGERVQCPRKPWKAHVPTKKGSKETSGSHRFTCCWCSRCVPKPRCACRDPLRRAKQRLV